MEGMATGSTVGISLGLKDGTPVGALEGLILGRFVRFDGLILGDIGENEGFLLLGLLPGLKVGAEVEGIAVGSAAGRSVGTSVGIAFGGEVGHDDGTPLGALIGLRLGFFVRLYGTEDGLLVGM
jgi:hypothetical protein